MITIIINIEDMPDDPRDGDALRSGDLGFEILGEQGAVLSLLLLAILGEHIGRRKIEQPHDEAKSEERKEGREGKSILGGACVDSICPHRHADYADRGLHSCHQTSIVCAGDCCGPKNTPLVPEKTASPLCPHTPGEDPLLS